MVIIVTFLVIQIPKQDEHHQQQEVNENVKGVSSVDVSATTKVSEDTVQNDGRDTSNSFATPHSAVTTKVEASAYVESLNVQNLNTTQSNVQQIDSTANKTNQPTGNQQVIYSTPLHPSTGMQTMHDSQIHTGNKGISVTNQQQNYAVPPQTLPLGKAANRMQQPKVLQQGMPLQGQNQAPKQFSQPTPVTQPLSVYQSQSGQQVVSNSTSQSQIGVANQNPLNQQQSLQNKANPGNNVSQQAFVATTPNLHPSQYQQLPSQLSSRMQQNNQSQQSSAPMVHLQSNNQAMQQQQSQNPAALYPSQQGGIPAMPRQSLPQYPTAGQNAASVVHQGVPVAHNTGLLHNSQSLLQQPPGQLYNPNQKPSPTLTAQQQALLTNSGLWSGIPPQMAEPEQADALWQATMQQAQSVSQSMTTLATQLFNKLCSGSELSHDQYNFLLNFLMTQQHKAQGSLEAGAADLRNPNFNRLQPSLFDSSVLLGLPLRQSMPALPVPFHQDHVNDWTSRRYYQLMQMQLLRQMPQQPQYESISDVTPVTQAVSDTHNTPFNRWEPNTNPVSSVNANDPNLTAVSLQAASHQFQPDQSVKQNASTSIELADNGLQNYGVTQPSVHSQYNPVRNVQATIQAAVQNTPANATDRLGLQSEQIANTNIAPSNAIPNANIKIEQQTPTTNPVEVGSRGRTTSINSVNDASSVSSNEAVIKLPEDNQQAPSFTVTEETRHSRFKIKKITENMHDAGNAIEVVSNQSQANEGLVDTVSMSSIELISPATQGSDVFFNDGLNDDAVIQSYSCPNITSYVDQSPDGDKIVKNHAISLSDSDCSELSRLNRLSKDVQFQASSQTGYVSAGPISGDTVRLL